MERLTEYHAGVAVIKNKDLLPQAMKKLAEIEDEEEKEKEQEEVLKDFEEDIAFIAHHYGYESQSRQLIEEMAELTQAINKKWRAENNGLYRGYYDDFKAIIEELADVQICIEQVRLLLGIKDKQIENAMESKIIREKARILKNNKNKPQWKENFMNRFERRQ
ncbi:hypothetical protein [Anaerostipes sp. 494a]|uniref:hypothetical protein n=1 Tax=Anaerostipes sp. 494a TaxID=1261636 RepID=UPI0009FAC249|nr:hypothetical protein [Anaerostipes sp. 494a]